MPASTCAQVLQDDLTIHPKLPYLSQQNQLVEGFLINQLENNSGVFAYDSRQYLASARLDHRISEKDQLFVRYNYGHALEESPDVQSLTGYSRGSAVKVITIHCWRHGSLFSPSTENEVRAQYSYNHVNVIPNEPAEVDWTFSAWRTWERTSSCPTTRCCGAMSLRTTSRSPAGTIRSGWAGRVESRQSHANECLSAGRFETGPISGGVLSRASSPVGVRSSL